MNVQLNIPPETEARIRESAAAAGQDLETFVLQAVTGRLVETERAPGTRNVEQWKRLLRSCIDLHPVTTHFVDDSRESIYAGRGE